MGGTVIGIFVGTVVGGSLVTTDGVGVGRVLGAMFGGTVGTGLGTTD